MPRLRFDETSDSLRITVTPARGARVIMVLLLFVNIAFAVALTLELVRLVCEYGGIPSPRGFIAALALVVLVFVAAGLAIVQLGESHVVELRAGVLVVQRRVFGRGLRRKESLVGALASFVEPVKPHFFSLAVSPVDVLVLDHAPDVGISRNIVGGQYTHELKARLNAFLSAHKLDSSAG